MRNKWYTYLMISLVIIPLITVYAYQDDLTVVFNSWSSGEPKIMVKLEIHLPQANTDFCGVVVRRLPSPKRPTRTGFSEEVYLGKHKPGETIVVKQLLTAIVAKARSDGGEYKVEYYEPVEYFIVVACVKGNRTVYRYGKVHEVYPNKLITTHKIEVNFEEQNNKVSVGDLGSYETNTLSCNLYQVNPPLGALDAAECITWVRGPYLYSLPGLKTAFGLVGGPIPSAVYLESYSDSASCILDNCDHETPQWGYAGKRLAYSVISGETAQLSGRWRDRVYFNTKYVYEKWYVSFDGFAGIGMLVWLLYPVYISGVQRSATLPGVPNEQEYLSIIPPAPSYSNGPFRGDVTIWFTPAYESSSVVASITISFSYVLDGWSVSLAVNFYEAGRNDNSYTTPYVSVEDVSGNTQGWYYWWYRDNDSMSYTVQFSNYR
mgnify:CR=1 FL=1